MGLDWKRFRRRAGYGRCSHNADRTGATPDWLAVSLCPGKDWLWSLDC